MFAEHSKAEYLLCSKELIHFVIIIIAKDYNFPLKQNQDIKIPAYTWKERKWSTFVQKDIWPKYKIDLLFSKEEITFFTLDTILVIVK